MGLPTEQDIQMAKIVRHEYDLIIGGLRLPRVHYKYSTVGELTVF